MHITKGNRGRSKGILTVACGLLMALGALPEGTEAQTTTRVSVDSNGAQALGGASLAPVITGDGKFVVFSSFAGNLVPDDAFGSLTDVFIRDRETGQTTRVSVDSNGIPANGVSGGSLGGFYDVSDDGRFVVFNSYSSNLDGAGIPGIFFRDRNTGTTTRVSLKSNGTPGEGNVLFDGPTMTADGRFVAFSTGETDFVTNDTNGGWDIFVRDRTLGETTRVNVASDGSQGTVPFGLGPGSAMNPVISADGRFVAFCSTFTNLVLNDNNFAWDVFVHDRQTGQTTRTSVNSRSDEGNGHSCVREILSDSSIDISDDGRFVAFASEATNLVANDTNRAADIFVHDRQTKETTRVSLSTQGIEGNNPSKNPRISRDGRYVVFESDAWNLVAPDERNSVTDIYLHDRLTGLTTRLSDGPNGDQGNLRSNNPDISADGKIVAFDSRARNLVAGDTNGSADIFVHELSQVALTVSKDGTGHGHILSNPLGIDCGADCTESFVPATDVLLTPTPDAGSVFTSWSGGSCAGMGPCSITLTSDTTIIARFDLLPSPPSGQVTLQVIPTGRGSGTVTSSPVGITCGSDCSESYSNGAGITLTAVASPGSVFLGWNGGGCSGTGPCVLTLTAKTTVSAIFANPSVTETRNDLDGDGRADLLWRNTQNGSTAIWLLDGSGITASGFPGGVPLAWQVAGIGDVNGDGKADVIWRHSTSATVGIWLMDGATITSVGFPASVPTAWNLQAVGDVNGDSKADLLWRNSNDGNTVIWLMNGTKIAASGFLGKVSLTWRLEGMGDVDADGKADLIWQNGTSNAVAVWLMNGLRMTSVGFPGSGSSDFQIAGVGDVNGDSKADLVWRNLKNGEVVVWLLNGTIIASTGSLGGLPSEWQIVQVADTDGDGINDVFWRNNVSGQVAVWKMNGLSLPDTVFPGKASTDWEIQ